MQILQPPGWATPRGYANGIAAAGRIVFVAGQVGWNANGAFESRGFVAQSRQALANVVAVLAEAGGRPEHIARMTWYVVDKDEYLASLRARLRLHDVVPRDAVLDPDHERREQRFTVDQGSGASSAVAVTRIWEVPVELLRLLVVTLQDAVVVMIGSAGRNELVAEAVIGD